MDDQASLYSQPTEDSGSLQHAFNDRSGGLAFYGIGIQLNNYPHGSHPYSGNFHDGQDTFRTTPGPDATEQIRMSNMTPELVEDVERYNATKHDSPFTLHMFNKAGFLGANTVTRSSSGTQLALPPYNTLGSTILTSGPSFNPASTYESLSISSAGNDDSTSGLYSILSNDGQHEPSTYPVLGQNKSLTSDNLCSGFSDATSLRTRKRYRNTLYRCVLAPCSEGNICFSTPNGLIRHMRSQKHYDVVRGPRYKCPVCHKTDPRDDNLRSHLRNVHKWTDEEAKDTKKYACDEGSGIEPVIREVVVPAGDNPPNLGKAIEPSPAQALAILQYPQSASALGVDPQWSLIPPTDNGRPIDLHPFGASGLPLVEHDEPRVTDDEVSIFLASFQTPEDAACTILRGLSKVMSKRSVQECLDSVPEFSESLTKAIGAKSTAVFLPCPWPLCFKTFPRRSNLSKHVMRHTKPFLCPRCGKQSGSKDDWDRHLQLHLRVRIQPDELGLAAGGPVESAELL